ncbi:ABC transporter permease [Brevibacterium samyangense]|uniref:ABC transporter permease n=1 Tax=Brevibacterium samyangense TaxID=366888 RepID=A0ABN2T2E1_9MICO
MTHNPTARLVATRLLHGLLVLWAAYTLSFLVLYALPGDPVAIMLGGADQISASPEQVAALRAEYGFDKPLPVQYLLALAAALTGDLGTSYATGQPVTAAILAALPGTLELAFAALVPAVLGGAALALAAAHARRPFLRNLLAGLPGLGISLPTFWVGLVLLQVFSFRLGLVPALGATGIAGLVLPALTLALPIGATIAQVLLRALDSAESEQFVTTFRAAGLGRGRILLTHRLRIALVSLVSIGGVLAGNLLGGAVVVETVFTRNGLGRLAESSVTAQDIPVVQGIVVFSALVFVLVNLVTDLLYPVLDPRTRERTRERVRTPERQAGPVATAEAVPA